MKCKYCSNPYNENFIAETNFWYIYIANQNYSLGRCLIVLKRHSNNINELTYKEKIEFLEIIKRVEKAVYELYKPISIELTTPKDHKNIVILPDSHVHYHLKPVYKNTQVYADYTHFYLGLKKFLPSSAEVREKVLKDIQHYLINNLNSPLTL